ncbi:NAD-binding protein [Methanobrevibacter sp. TMH8]|uniref:NAD-binding protein n=1 Tax=Methanobrevibacter sp. TMH8 TaxID=2848611 RepID=UPI001CCEFDE9|nr:NAD-binding protein [Methanobrevibacter sp. TMH8]MBZ9570139.1 NAD-binding protein [Methanobrevibacter sp. TMH8]
MSSKPRESRIKKVFGDVPSHILIYALIALSILISYGIIGSLLIMKLDIVNSIYFTIITITTVGYGDIIPLLPIQKMFAVTLAIGGVGLIAYVFGLTISLVGQRIEELRSGVRMKRTIKSLKDHYILCGYGRVGAVVAEELEKRNQTIVIIDKNRDIVENLEEESDILVIHGDATDESSLHKAGIDNATGIILATGSDVDNLFIALTSREISKDIWIVSRASKKENISRLYNSGANKVISPEESGGTDIYFAAIQPNLVKITTKHDSKDIKKEMEIIIKYGCSIENIEYHYPYFKEPLKRKIEASSIEQVDKFLGKIDSDMDTREALESIYEIVNGIHSHWVSGPNHETLEKMVEALKKENLIFGVNLSHDEIMEIAKKYGKFKVILKKEDE